MTSAELDAFEKWLDMKVRQQADGATERVLEHWQYAAAVGVKKGFLEALGELRHRRSGSGQLPEDKEDR